MSINIESRISQTLNLAKGNKFNYTSWITKCIPAEDGTSERFVDIILLLLIKTTWNESTRSMETVRNGQHNIETVTIGYIGEPAHKMGNSSSQPSRKCRHKERERGKEERRNKWPINIFSGIQSAKFHLFDMLQTIWTQRTENNLNRFHNRTKE